MADWISKGVSPFESRPLAIPSVKAQISAATPEETLLDPTTQALVTDAQAEPGFTEDAPPQAPAGPGVADAQADYGGQMADVTSSPAFQLLGMRTPARYVENQKKNLLEAYGETYYGGAGMPTFEQTMADAGINITPPGDFDVNAAADTFEPPMRLESETHAEYTQRTRAMAQQHIKSAEAEHLSLQLAYENDMQGYRSMYEEEMRANARDMSKIAEPGGPNIFQAQTEGHTWKTEAEQTQLQTVASRLEQTAAEMRDATAQVRSAEEARQQRVEDEHIAAQVVQDTLKSARERLDAQPDPDAGRYFRSMSGGQKFLALLGGILTGWNGSTMMPQMLMQLAERDLESQKAAIAKRQAEVGAASIEHAGQMSIYQHVLAQVKDERAADLMVLSLQMEDAERMLASEMARTTVDIHKASMYQIMVGLKEQQAKLFYELQARIKAMPDKIAVGGRSVLTDDQRKVLVHVLKTQGAEGVKLMAEAAGIPWKVVEGELAHQANLERDAAKDARKAAGEVDADTNKIDAAIASVDEIIQQYGGAGGVDIPGQAGTWENPLAGAEAQAARAKIGLAVRMIGKAIEDDRFSDADAKAYAKNLQGDWRTVTDDQLVSKLVEGQEVLRKLRGRRPKPQAAAVPDDFQED